MIRAFAVIIAVMLWAALMILAAGINLALAQAHQHPPEHEALHEKFYQRWMMPIDWDGTGRRTKSCCDKKDCYPTQVKREGDKWFYLHRETQDWREIPNKVIEQNHDDAEESPDGLPHVCANNTYTFCFTHGGGA
jgi:hypothetical protein